jgi:hypothetical protein
VERFTISSNCSSRNSVPIAVAVHALLNDLLVTMRCKANIGVQIEGGNVKSMSCTGSILENVLAENKVIKTRPQTGDYANVPFIIAPIRNDSGAAIAAIGMVGITGIFNLAKLMDEQSKIISQMHFCAVPVNKS